MNQLYRRRSSIKNRAGINFGNENILNYYNKKTIKKIVNISFRDAITSKIALKLLAILSDNDDYETQHDYFNVLLLLLDMNPKNKELMCENNAVKFIIELILSSSQILNICNIYLHHSMMKENQRRKGVEMGVVTRLTDEEINESSSLSLLDIEYRSGSPAYIELVNILGTYNITPDIIKLLFQVAYNPVEIIQSIENNFHDQQSDINNDSQNDNIDVISINETFNETVVINEPSNEISINIMKVQEPDDVNNDNSIDEVSNGIRLDEFLDKDGNILDNSQKFDSSQNLSNSIINEEEFNDDLSKIQLNMLYTIEKLSEKTNPFCFFNFDGIDGCFKTYSLSNYSFLSQGYTFSCWINIRAFIENESGLLCFENQQKLGIPLELYFKSFSNSGNYCLCMRIQLRPLPPEDFVFDGFDFSDTGVWHYIMLTIDGKSITLYVDGDLIQTYESSNYQKITKSDNDVIAIIAQCIKEKMEKEISGLETALYGTCEGGCTSHIIISIKDIIEKIGDIQLCLPFLEYKGEYQLTSLKIISSLLYKCPENVERFRKANGFYVLNHLLQKNIENISAEIFDVLFDIMSDDIIKNNQLVITIIDCLYIINDLLIISPNHIQIAVLRLITFILVDVPENMATWREHIGIDVIFEFTSFLQSQSHPFILRILDVMMKDFTIKELEKSFLYISSQREKNIEFKCDILELLYRHISNSEQSVEQLREIGGISLLIPLLDCSYERFRILILRMIGILMKTNIAHSEELLDRIVGYDVIKYYLLPYHMTPELAEVLISMALNQYSMELTSSIIEDISSSKTTKHKRLMSDESISVEKGIDVDVLIYPRMIYLIIELLENDENGDLVIQVLNDIEKLLTPNNMGKLWDYPWIEWTYIFLQNLNNYGDNSMYRIINIVDLIIQKMMIYDLSRNNSVTEAKKGALSEDDDMESRIIVNVLIYFDNNPYIQQEESIYIINNMIYLYNYMKESLPFSIQLNYHFANVINHLACHNNSIIRTQMKTSHFFEIRDDLIIDILKSELYLEDVEYFLEKFSFEILANQSKFRESDGLLFLLRTFHRTHEHYSVQSLIGNILINTIMPIPINSQIIRSIIQDDVVFEKLIVFQAKQKENEMKKQERIQNFIDYRNKYNNKLNLLLEELELHYKTQLENNEKLYQNNLNKIKAERFKRNEIGYQTLNSMFRVEQE
ncbi:hypothetical protein BCR32DRAFT_272586 [Anaeromyces robustus]|uniref:DUF4704 domain-containing protein n=1 Tax=Anaeromyces robustus TaxID=1754192 RepID=A0A1Y1W1F8_9FUNG|nr:hypothetical protein BCR32DRAFT_272586 [Anaeromyces robustus]|eukprot:ORX67341.1 hypothetical protein BCR32DRAFT_272586 [Anaeromyces robustus]